MTDKQNEKIREIMTETARVQLATVNAGIVFWKNWVDFAAEFSQTVTEELLKVGQEGTEKDQSLTRITDSSQKLLRKMTKLPDLAVSQFKSDLEQANKPQKKRTRSAKVKS